jgi:cell division protein FtsL
MAGKAINRLDNKSEQERISYGIILAKKRLFPAKKKLGITFVVDLLNYASEKKQATHCNNSMKANSKDFSKICTFICVCLLFADFLMSLFLVKPRQDIISYGRKISEWEQVLSLYAEKNAELDVNILRLSSSNHLHDIISANGFVVVDAHNTIKVSKSEANFYALTLSSAEIANKFVPDNFPKQTNLNTPN